MSAAPTAVPLAADVPTVSVIVPVGGVDDLLPAQLDAVLAQQFDGVFEVVLSLNSPDPTQRERLDALVDGRGGRVRIVDSSNRRGAAHARNVGARAARADRFVFCDADDLVEAGWLAAIVEALGSFDAVTGHLEEELLQPGQRSWRTVATPGELPKFLGVPYLISCNMAISRAVFDDVGGFDESLHRCEDIAIGLSLQQHRYRLGYASAATIHYRHRSSFRSLLQQHYHYGRGMSQVLVRYGLPAGEAAADSGAVAPGAPATRPSGLGLLRPNKNVGQRPTFGASVRRAATLSGRLVGLVEERIAQRRRASRAAGHEPGSPAADGLRRVTVFGLPFVAADAVTPVADALLARSRAGERDLLVVTPNVDHLVQYRREPRLQDLAAQAQYVLPDGSPVVAAARLLRRPLGRRLTGSDLFVPVWNALKEAAEPVVVLATSDDTARRLADEHAGASVLVAPFFDIDDADARWVLAERVMASVEATDARLVVIGLPLPKHHDIAADLRVLARQGRPSPALLLIGSAADFHVGTKARAPQIFQRFGIEWLHRLLSEPRRLARRYLVDDLAFLPIVLREALRRRSAEPDTR